MNVEYAQYLPEDFHPTSRVWVYQSNRLFSIGEALEIEDMLKEFLEQWNSHGVPVKGYANLLFGQFLIFMADETDTGVSGCSTDSSVRIVKKIESQFKVNMFDRQTLAFVIKDKIQVIPMSQLGYAMQHHFITPDTLYFNNLVNTKDQLLHDWIIPVKQSWLAKRKEVRENLSI
ncbi:hypothetical protein FC093_09460 [Ilyomonas limi]|uniref:ABC transporter ATPase n=1 Tax=Ilyomonas limi TaxID=2575867 RepID=A0A4U3L1A5_9BACT|nr:hypothetical protein [Ilyomonas limi]TKK68911.1 hypothetical protein FC093_09460 [Ilyomonas limi]